MNRILKSIGTGLVGLALTGGCANKNIGEVEWLNSINLGEKNSERTRYFFRGDERTGFINGRPYVFGFREIETGGTWTVQDYVQKISQETFLPPLEEKMPGLAERIKREGINGIEVREYKDPTGKTRVQFIDEGKVVDEYTY